MRGWLWSLGLVAGCTCSAPPAEAPPAEATPAADARAPGRALGSGASSPADNPDIFTPRDAGVADAAPARDAHVLAGDAGDCARPPADDWAGWCRRCPGQCAGTGDAAPPPAPPAPVPSTVESGP